MPGAAGRRVVQYPSPAAGLHTSPPSLPSRPFSTLTIGSRITVRIPRLDSYISVSDTFLLLAILLCGGEAAVLLAALDGFCSTLRIAKKAKTYLLNMSVMAASTFVTVWVMRLCFGPVESQLHEADARTF